MDAHSVVDDWDAVPFDGGFGGIDRLASQGFDGAIEADGTWLFLRDGEALAIVSDLEADPRPGDIDAFEDATGQKHEAPAPVVATLAAMLALGGDVRGQYFTDDTPLDAVDETLSGGGFTGYVELSENVLSGDYYYVYVDGEVEHVGFVGSSQRLTGEEAESKAEGEVGIYDVTAVRLPRPELPVPDPEPDLEPDPEPDLEPVPKSTSESDSDRDTEGTAADAPLGGADGSDTDADFGWETGPAPGTAGEPDTETERAVGPDEPSDERATNESSTDDSSTDDSSTDDSSTDESRVVTSVSEGRSEGKHTAGTEDATPTPTPAVADDRAESGTRADASADHEVPGPHIEEYESRIEEYEAGVEEYESRVEEYESRIEEYESRIGELESELADADSQVAELEAEISSLRDERDDLKRRLDTGDTPQSASLSPADALAETRLFVREDSRSGGTLSDAHDGDADREAVTSNLRIEYHTTFEDEGTSVEGRPFESWLRSSETYEFVEWLVTEPLFEIRSSDAIDGVRPLYDALPEVDRVGFEETITVGGDTEGQDVEFDIVARDKRGNPLFVVAFDTGRDPTYAETIEPLVTDASDVCAAHETLAGAVAITSSYFESDAMAVVGEATGSSLLSRSKYRSYVKLSRTNGYHLCLVEARDDSFTLTVPEL